jgi:hypothetical protein
MTKLSQHQQRDHAEDRDGNQPDQHELGDRPSHRPIAAELGAGRRRPHEHPSMRRRDIEATASGVYERSDLISKPARHADPRLGMSSWRTPSVPARLDAV